MTKVIGPFDGQYKFLSNFYPLPDSHLTLEHWYQAAKTNSEFEKEQIFKAQTPSKAKRLGRKCELREDWDEVKFQVMKDFLIRKFNHGELKKKLLETFPAELVELNNWHDNIWGNCTCPRCQNTEGQNMLGELLMEVRAELAEKVW